MRTFAIGDIHGAHKALVQCLERSSFDRENDLLINLGDVCDGWPFVYHCVEELLTIKHRIDMKGNHDEWFIKWLQGAGHPDQWRQGGHATAQSYIEGLGVGMIHKEKYAGTSVSLQPTDIPAEHWKFFMHMHDYYVDDKNRCFVHAGFRRDKPIVETRRSAPSVLWLDRDLWNQALSCKGGQKLKTADGFSSIFIGHTTCYHIDEGRPVISGGVINLDTGAGWEGKLTIMDVDTEEYWQSDMVAELYPDIIGRR